MRTLVAVVVLLSVLAGITGAAIWSGAYDVAARRPHSRPVQWLLTTARDRSIAAHSRNVTVPPLDRPEQIRGGFEEFDEMCPVCHGEPGGSPSAVRQGLNPPAPHLADDDVQRRYTDAELFWILKNGVRMTGMPAFGDTHDDDTLWSIVAFVRRLPRLGAAGYAKLEHDLESASADHDHHH
jgi:mono/diheme cytochrome c family protein